MPMPAPDTLPIPPTDRIATALERIAEALDNLAALHAAGPALKATGAEPQWVQWEGDTLYPPPGVTGYVDYRMRNGKMSKGMAEFIDWRDTGSDWNVTHYRVISQ